jgi:hypothetical protein
LRRISTLRDPFRQSGTLVTDVGVAHRMHDFGIYY